MADYLGRTADCTNGTSHPSHNLSSYAAANGFTTALLGVTFKGVGNRPTKIYTYWGHTGIKRGDYIEVLVPRTNHQETVVVRVQAVLPADAMKDDGYTAKHMLRLVSRPGEVGNRPRLVSAFTAMNMLERWISTTSLRIAPFALSPHARECIDAINKVLVPGTVTEYDTNLQLAGKQIHTAIVDDLDDEESPPESLKLKVTIPKRMGKSAAMERCAAELHAVGLNVTVPSAAADHDLVIEDVLALDKVNEQLRPTKEDRIDAMQYAFHGKIDGSIDWKVGTAALDLKTLAEHYAGTDPQSFYQQYMLQPMYSKDGQNLKRHASFSPAHAAPYGAGSCSMTTFDQHQQAYYQATVMTSPPDEFLLMHEPWRLYQWYMVQSCLRVDYVSSTGIYTIVGDDSARAIPEKARNWLEGERSQRRIREKAARLGAMYSSGPNDMLAFAKAINPEVHLHPYQEKAIIRMMAAAPPAEIKPYNPDVYTKENILMSKIETVTYVTLPGNSARRDASTVAKTDYFNAIALLERQIETLEKVKHKPASLRQEIEDLNKQIDELGQLCDLYYAKKEPILGQAEQSDAKDSTGDATSYIARPDRD